ncbi:MAG: hypothetical protein PHR25_03940 [Clostridia bacterium]|nr:hypothetical protein [Clostridia bacterium]MDD4375913.1 hypothetical protein [Clostridia bacterium]
MKKNIMLLTLLIILFISVVAIISSKMIKELDKPKNNINEVENNNESSKIKESNNIEIVPTMDDQVSTNSAWCGTFQLVWNDMKNEVVKQNVVFTPQLKMVENLNKENFTSDMLSEESYYKKYGLKSLELKEEIERGIKEKFNETSDIINDIDWSEEALNNPSNPFEDRYFFYVMLRKNFEFEKEFNKLEAGEFNNGNYTNVRYFGLDKKSPKEQRKQVEVLYYNSLNDFALKLKTKDDEVIFYKNPTEDTFNNMFSNILRKSKTYKGNKFFEKDDELKVPNIDFNRKKEYTELQEKKFLTLNGEGIIKKAIQTIEFKLDEKGGSIKSEAAIDMIEITSAMPTPEQARKFNLDGTFAMFLKEANSEFPYFAARIEDITKVQEDAEKIN